MTTFTNSAAKKFAEIMSKEEKTGTNLRVYVEGGGCSGFKYGFQFDDNIAEDDLVVETDGVKLLIDPISLAYLNEAEIDYKDDALNGSSFVIRNPGAKSTCGCGESFNA